jgi:hypothetical protein
LGEPDRQTGVTLAQALARLDISFHWHGIASGKHQHQEWDRNFFDWVREVVPGFWHDRDYDMGTLGFGLGHFVLEGAHEVRGV